MSLMLLLLLAATDISSLSKEDRDTIANARESANTYADCAGWWDFMSQWQAEKNNPASAEQLRNLGNGAQTAALWIYGQAHSLESTKRVTYGTWLPVVQPRREGALLRLKALSEQDDVEAIKETGRVCTALLEGQQKAIDAIRADTVQQAIDSPK